MIFASRRAEAYAILWLPPTEIASDTQCVFVFLRFFFTKNTKTQWPNFVMPFFSNRTAPENRCVFVFFFLTKNTKTQGPNFVCVFFQQYNCTREPLCFCVFLKKSTKTIFFGFFRNRIAAESLSVFTEDSLYCDSKGQSANSMRAE